LFDRLIGQDENAVHTVATPPSLSLLTEWVARLDAIMAAPGDLRMPPIGVR
jgi:hypothetical protein